MLSFATLSCAAKISIRYEKPASPKYDAIYKALKSNHKKALGESADYLNRLYRWPDDIVVTVTDCGYVNSRYESPGTVIICYESLYSKVYDYPVSAIDKKAFANRVLQNTMFTFWHEIGHAAIDQFEIGSGLAPLLIETYADEFAILSMLWRSGQEWKDVVMISALHYKQKSEIGDTKDYKNHPDDRLRYEKMIALLYGFSQKSYSRLSSEVDQIQWLNKSAQAYYLERSNFWERFLRIRTRRDFFDN